MRVGEVRTTSEYNSAMSYYLRLMSTKGPGLFVSDLLSSSTTKSPSAAGEALTNVLRVEQQESGS